MKGYAQNSALQGVTEAAGEQRRPELISSRGESAADHGAFGRVCLSREQCTTITDTSEQVHIQSHLSAHVNDMVCLQPRGEGNAKLPRKRLQR